MPATPPNGQPLSIQIRTWTDWFADTSGQAVLDSEMALIHQALGDTRGLAWLWLAPRPLPLADALQVRGLHLHPEGDRWAGAVHCAIPLPLASESVGVVIVQHLATQGEDVRVLLEECARVLAPGGRLLLFELNPLAPYRWHWRSRGQRATEPLVWRRRLRRCGLEPAPLSQGLGPRWRPEPDPSLQSGAGLRAAYVLQAHKRRLPMTPLRGRRSALVLDNAGVR